MSWLVVESNMCLPDFFSLLFFGIRTTFVTKVVPGVCFLTASRRRWQYILYPCPFAHSAFLTIFFVKRRRKTNNKNNRRNNTIISYLASFSCGVLPLPIRRKRCSWCSTKGWYRALKKPRQGWCRVGPAAERIEETLFGARTTSVARAYPTTQASRSSGLVRDSASVYCKWRRPKIINK